VIAFESVGVTLGDAEVLSDVSLAVPEGQFLAVVGPNGAGKTTLLGTCNGLVAPTAGRVTIDGDHVASLSARELGTRVATVPQETSLAFDFDVEAVVRMGRTPHRSRLGSATETDRAAVQAALERTDTARFADRSVGSLSGGERQRVLLAQALAQDTPVLLLDEPTANLDINHQIETLSLARELADDGKTVVAAIHDLELAARFCDAVALLSNARVAAKGPPADVLTPDRLEGAFGVRVAVGVDPVTGARTVTPLADGPPADERVHVVGTGEGAARVLGRLADAGIEVTVGVVPEGDVAREAARGVARDVVTAPPFEHVSAEARETASTLAADADVTVVVGDVSGANAAAIDASDPVIGVEGPGTPATLPVVSAQDLVPAVHDPEVTIADRLAQSDDD